MIFEDLLKDAESREQLTFLAFEAAHFSYEDELHRTFEDPSLIRNTHRSTGESGSMLRALYHDLLRTRSEWVLARTALKLLRERMEENDARHQ